MVNKIPDLHPRDVFNVKETCYILDINKTTLMNRRKRGLIEAIEVGKNRYKYTGAAIRKFWRLENSQI